MKFNKPIDIVIPSGTNIKKPRSTKKLQWHESVDGRKFMTCGPKRLYLHELVDAFRIFRENGKFDRETFKFNFREMAKNRPCNFTTIGGVLVKLGLAVYDPRGFYRKA